MNPVFKRLLVNILDAHNNTLSNNGCNDLYDQDPMFNGMSKDEVSFLIGHVKTVVVEPEVHVVSDFDVVSYAKKLLLAMDDELVAQLKVADRASNHAADRLKQAEADLEKQKANEVVRRIGKAKDERLVAQDTEIDKLRTALEKITAIKNKDVGGDWDIAHEALK